MAPTIRLEQNPRHETLQRAGRGTVLAHSRIPEVYLPLGMSAYLDNLDLRDLFRLHDSIVFSLSYNNQREEVLTMLVGDSDGNAVVGPNGNTITIAEGPNIERLRPQPYLHLLPNKQ